MDYWAVALALVAIALAIYYNCFRGLDYFKKHNIPHIPPLPGLGNQAPFILRQIPMAELVQRIYNFDPTAKYVGMFDFMNPVVMIRDPDLIKSIGVKNFESFPSHRVFVDEKQDPLFGKNLFSLHGERWKDVRNLLTPAFTSSKMKYMFTLMSDCAADFGEFISKLPEEKREMEMKDAFTRYTNDVIATCAFGISVDSMRKPKNEFYVYGREATNFNGYKTLKAFAIRSFPNLTTRFGVRLISNHIADFFHNIVQGTIQARDEQGIHRPDMIQLMMETRGKREGKELTIDDMTSQAFIFFFGGFDTTSTLMCFTAHAIAVYPEIQEKLQEEVDKVLEATKGAMSYEAINGMEYLDAVINEALRLYPVAVFADRLCERPFELPPAHPGGKPFMVEKGMSIWFPVYGIQRDPQYFEDPDKFKPERFLGEGKRIHNSGAYIPFGLGPRMCIGNRFALLETKVLLFQLMARCDFKPCSRTGVPLKLQKSGFAMLAEGGFWLKVDPRKNPHPSIANRTSNGTCKPTQA